MNVDRTSCPEGIEPELKRLQGSWKQIGYERDGLVNPRDEQGWEPRTTFTGEEFVVTLADGTVVIKGTYRIDPTQNPKTVDWTDTIGEDAGKTLLAIYSLQGDRFTFCAAYAGLERPMEFRTRPGQVLRIFRREAQASNKDEAQCLAGAAEPAAAPNLGPARPLGNSEAGKGPPG